MVRQNMMYFINYTYRHFLLFETESAIFSGADSSIPQSSQEKGKECITWLFSVLFFHMGNAICNAVYPSSIFFMCYMTSNKTLPIYLLRQIFSFYLLACCSFYYIDVSFLQKGSTMLGVSDSFWHFIWNFFSWRMWFRLFCFLECSSNKDKTYFIVVRSCEKLVRHSSRKNVCLTDAPL